MNSKKNERDIVLFLQDIPEAMNDIEEFVEGMEFNRFSSDKKTRFAVLKALENIGEATKNLPDDLKDKYPNVPWKLMAGMRDKVIHGYFDVNPPIIWSTTKKDVPFLKPFIEGILEDIKNE